MYMYACMYIDIYIHIQSINKLLGPFLETEVTFANNNEATPSSGPSS